MLLLSQPAHDILGTSPEDPLKVLTSGNYREPSGDPQGTNTKTDDLMKKFFFRSNISCITYLFLFFTARRNIQSFKRGRLQDFVAGRPGDQMMGCSRDVPGTLVKHVF